MTFGRPFKEVYIHLVENESAFVCTVRYAGFLTKSTQFSLEIRPRSLENESPPIVRSRFGPSPQGGHHSVADG